MKRYVFKFKDEKVMDVFSASIPIFYKTIEQAEYKALEMNKDYFEIATDFDIVEIEFKTVKRVKYK